MPRRFAARPPPLPADVSAVRTLADQAFSRAANAPLVGGNRVRILRDAAENYPAWDRAIRDARHTIHVEMYIIHHDATGRRFIELLAERARAGVAVRLIYDWFGCGFGPAFGLFRPLIKAGGQVRVFNPPAFNSALGWIRRNHRKLIVTDTAVAFVAGLCVGRMWEGKPERREGPWRDTGVEIIGPSVLQAEQAFVESWRLCGGQLDVPVPPRTAPGETEGPVHLRLVPTEPLTANLLRVDLLVATLARRRLWITDAYFVGHGPYLEALRRAARDGVDVRLILPQGSDVGWTVPLTRTLYRTLLKSGVRIFEWNGTMVHAKTAVADSRWARVGSSNLNLTSWIGNWELDVAFDDPETGQILEEHFLDDLDRSTEITYDAARGLLAGRPGGGARARVRRSARRTVRTVTGLSRSLGAAITGSRPLEDFEYPPLFVFGLMLAAIAVVSIIEPRVFAWPTAILTGWAAATFLAEAIGLWWRRKQP
jgi:CDP-diacylglycerol--glycerol-3-phosphate 3-phosphatidyltransferase/cardiolipin synthase